MLANYLFPAELRECYFNIMFLFKYLFGYFNRHVISAPSSVNSYAGGSFPGVTDAIFNANGTADWNEIHRQLDIVAIHIRYATQIMNQPGVNNSL